MNEMKHCPACGAEQAQRTPFCRKCGVDLRGIPTALAQPEIVTGASGRDEVLRAIAAKIKELWNPDELEKTVNEVLPKVRELLESPEEKRLKRIRDGVGWAAIGLGIALYFILKETVLREGNLMIAAACVAVLVGLAYVINGIFFSLPDRKANQKLLEIETAASTSPLPEDHTAQTINAKPTTILPYTSVTEETTRHLETEPRPTGKH